jgi:hypothetical protein
MRLSVSQILISSDKTKFNSFGWCPIDIRSDKCADGICEDVYYPGYFVDFQNRRIYAIRIFLILI